MTRRSRTLVTDVIQVQELLTRLDGSGSETEWEAVLELRTTEGDRLPSLLLKHFRSSPRAGARASCVYHATRFAKTNQEALTLGLEALADRAHAVRNRACALLAFSQRTDMLPMLRARLEAVPDDSKGDLCAAIDAIESRNHNFFLDRDHSGKVAWNVD